MKPVCLRTETGRRACQGIRFSRASVRYRRREKIDEACLRTGLHELAREGLRFGYRQMTMLLRLAIT